MNFPCYESGQIINAATSTAVTALVGTPARLLAATDLLLYNPGPNVVHVRAGAADVTADATCAPLPSGALWAYAKGQSTHLATLAIGSAQQILVIVGRGD